MRPATDCAPGRVPARRIWIAIGLALGATDLGCAGSRWLGRSEPEPPLLGMESRAGGYPSGPVLADSGRKPAPEGRDRDPGRSRAPSRSAGSGREDPIEVALQPPTVAPEPKPRREAPAEARPAAKPAPTVDSLVAGARDRLMRMTTYQVRVTRQERVGDVLQPSEDVVMSIRREPRAVRVEWPGGPHKGREVLYEAGGLMHINDPNNVLKPRINLPPDHPLVLVSSRHPITEAGFETILTHLEDELHKQRAGEPGADRVAYEGLETPEEVGHPCHKIVRTRAGGEVRTLYLDPETGLPALLLARTGDGSLLESYRFRDVRTDLPELAEASAFDAEGRWGAQPGLFSRLAGRPSADAKATQR